MSVLGIQTRLNRDEGRGKHALAKQILQDVRNAKGGAKGVGRIGIPTIMRKHPVTDETDQAAQ